MFSIAVAQSQLQKLHAPDRRTDALIIAATMGKPLAIRESMWVLKDEPTGPLFMITTEDAGRRLRADREREEIIHFFHDPNWFLFVERRVPTLTGSMEEAVKLGNRIFKEWAWAVNSDGDALIEIGEKNYESQNTIPAIALLDAILNVLSDTDRSDVLRDFSV